MENFEKFLYDPFDPDEEYGRDESVFPGKESMNVNTAFGILQFVLIVITVNIRSVIKHSW